MLRTIAIARAHSLGPGTRRPTIISALAAILLTALPATAGDDPNRPRSRNEVSPALRIERGGQDTSRHSGVKPDPGVRSIDGSGNNQSNPGFGAAGALLVRIAPAAYADGVSQMAGSDRLGPREISNLVNAQETPISNPLGASDYLWQWGQFLDHDLDLTDGTDPPEPQHIPVPTGDAFFDPSGMGSRLILFNRSLYDHQTGIPNTGPRQQVNEITAWIDASNVYGSDEVRAAALRAQDGSGRLRTSDGDLLPFNEEGLPNAGGSSAGLFLAGDVRANEQVGLTVMHTLFVREHNRWVDVLAAEHPDWDGDRLYEKARRLVGAEMQVITYREFLPALLGRYALASYRGYDPNVNAGIANEFATAAYRFGHSALSPTLLRLDASGNPIPQGPVPLRDAFFAPFRITDEGGIEPLLRGLAAQACQRVDVFVIDDVRNFLFGQPGSDGFDLASLNIQRGRDHGLPGYNAVRLALGLPRAGSFAEISSDTEVQARLAAAYASPDDVDLWVGGLAENPVPGGHVGELVRAILVEQFEALRDGDRFWYQRALSPDEITRVESLRLSDIIRLNTSIANEIPDNVFRVATAGCQTSDCTRKGRRR